MTASGISACVSTDFKSAPDAVLTNSTLETVANLNSTISGALGNRSVSITPDSFTQHSRVTIEHAPKRGPDGTPIMGRDLSKPDHFTLKKSGDQCALIHDETGTVYPLGPDVECEPSSPQG